MNGEPANPQVDSQILANYSLNIGTGRMSFGARGWAKFTDVQ